MQRVGARNNAIRVNDVSRNFFFLSGTSTLGFYEEIMDVNEFFLAYCAIRHVVLGNIFLIVLETIVELVIEGFRSCCSNLKYNNFEIWSSGSVFGELLYLLSVSPRKKTSKENSFLRKRKEWRMLSWQKWFITENINEFAYSSRHCESLYILLGSEKSCRLFTSCYSSKVKSGQVLH